MHPSRKSLRLLKIGLAMTLIPFTAFAGDDGSDSNMSMNGNGMGGPNAAEYMSGSQCSSHGDNQHCMVILLDHMERIKIGTPASIVMIGNPAIADVTLLDSQIAFVSAKSIGSTNMVALNAQGDEIINYQIIVQEPQVRRVSMRRAFTKENYQCAPSCNRALSMTDSVEAYAATSGVVSGRMTMSNQTTSSDPEVVQGVDFGDPEDQ